jgi:hypothetical protein
MTRARFSKQALNAIGSLPALRSYKNTQTVLTISNVSLTVADVVRAGVVGGLPVLLLSGTGDAKTLLAGEAITRWLAGRATVLRGDSGEPAWKAFLGTNLGRLFERSAKSDDELVEATERLGWTLVFIDELNRGVIGTLQNDFLSVVDGEINYRGRRFRLGRDYYSVIAAMNLGDEYGATQALDEAVRRRFPIVLDLDRFGPRLPDYARVEPRSSQPDSENWSEAIQTAHAGLRAAFRVGHSGLSLASLYVFEHLNRCQLRSLPKRLLVKQIPTLCETNACPHMERRCHLVRAIPPASALILHDVVIALQAVADARRVREGRVPAEHSIEGDFYDYLECLRVFLPTWNKLWIKDGDTELAHELADQLCTDIGRSFDEKRAGILAVTSGSRRFGDVDLGEWGPLVETLLEVEASSETGDFARASGAAPLNGVLHD